MTWILTQSYRIFDLFSPAPEMVHWGDVVRGLSRENRFTNQLPLRSFYTVAEHSVHVSCLVPREARLQALFHDAAEAYIGDISAPLKTMLGDNLAVIENRIIAAIGERFEIDFSLHKEAIKRADLEMLQAEKEQLYPNNRNYFPATVGIAAANVKLQYWSPRKAEEMFCRRYTEITGKEIIYV